MNKDAYGQPEHKRKDFCGKYSFIRKFGRYYTRTINEKEKIRGTGKGGGKTNQRENWRQRTAMEPNTRISLGRESEGGE